MRKGAMMLLMVGTTAMTGCFGEDVKETFETAQREERLRNYDHAEKLVGQIMEKHPGSAYATRATERLNALKPANDSQPGLLLRHTRFVDSHGGPQENDPPSDPFAIWYDSREIACRYPS
jgi:hypothetical protein